MRLLLLFLLVFSTVLGRGQTQIGGIVNSYYKVTNVDHVKSILTIEKTEASDPDLQRGDRVLIIQMKGASLGNITNSTSGNVSDSKYGGAGNYEVATVCSANNGTVALVHKLLRTYDFANGKVQVVKIPQYESAIVTSLLQPKEWNGETGGVLALRVADNLELKAGISANGKGFRGGAYVYNNGSCAFTPDNYYDPTPIEFREGGQTKTLQPGANKGESVVDLPLASQGGREAVGSGGGGGNNHNNGGGGGSNLTKGGIGGGNTSNPLLGACFGEYPGRGAYGLSNKGGERIFLGGGGGAGHGNNPLPGQTGGGNGGGIIFIEAGVLVNNSGAPISSNGEAGASTRGDGASGGGGGGTIILSVGAYSGTFNIDAKGGKGGTEDEIENSNGRCFGEGGGGGGGVLYIRGKDAPAGTISLAGGERGDKLNSDCPNSSRSLGGEAGIKITDYNYSRSMELSDGCPEGAPMPVVLKSFKVSGTGAQALATWEVANPEDAAHYILQRKGASGDWRDVQTIAAEEHATAYRKGDGPLAAGSYFYRLKIVEKDHSVTYSIVQPVTVKAEDRNRLVIYPNPATSEITIVAPVQEEWLNIYDMKSRLVYRKKVAPGNSVISQDISFLSEGVYMLQVGKLTARFVVFK